MIKVMFISFWVNLFLSTTKIIVGFFGMSYPLIADGISSLSDMITDVFAIVGGLIARKPADKTHPFGYGMVEYIASLLISIFIMIMGILVIYDVSFEEVHSPNYLILIYVIFAIFIKRLLVKYVGRKAVELKSDLLTYSSKESEADLIGTIIVLVSTILMMFSRIIPALTYANAIGTIIISLLIIKTGYNMLKFNAGELTLKRLSGSIHEDALKVINSFSEIKKIKKAYVFKYGNKYQILAELVLNEDMMLSEANKLSEEIEKKLKAINIKYVYIEMSNK